MAEYKVYKQSWITRKKGDLPLHHYVQLNSGAHAFYCAQDSERALPDSKCGQRKNFTFNATEKKGSIYMELHLHIPHIPSWINTYAYRQLYLSDLNVIQGC